MISASKLLIGVGALGTTGLASWGIYHVSSPKTIQDKLNREGLKILNLNKESDADKEVWKKRISDHKDTTESENLRISDLGLLTESGEDKEAENIKKFKNKCSQLLLASLWDKDVELKEKQVRKWCAEDPK